MSGLEIKLLEKCTVMSSLSVHIQSGMYCCYDNYGTQNEDTNVKQCDSVALLKKIIMQM